MRNSNVASAVIALLALVCFPPMVYGTTWNVPGQAPTIQAGIDSASAGDTVSVASGTYTWMTEGTGTSNGLITMKDGVCLRSAPGDPDSVVIDAQLSGRVIYMLNLGSGTALEGLTITGGTATLKGGGMYLDRSHPVIRSCYITGNQTTQWSASGNGIYGYWCSPTIENCVFSHNVPTAGDGMGGAINFYYYCYPTFTSCTFYANTAGFGSHISSTVSSNTTMDRCILAYGIDGEAANCYSNGTITMTCCNVYGNPGGNWTDCIAGQDGMNGNFSADPLFCDAPGGDFRLMTGSPCLNAPGCGLMGALGRGCPQPGYWRVPIDAPTIQAGIDSASAGDSIIVACGTYYEHDITLKSGVVVTSETGTWDCVTVDAQGISRAFEGNTLSSNTALTGFTVKHGRGVVMGGGMYVQDSDIDVTNCKFDSCQATSWGGGAAVQGGSPTFTNCFFYADTSLQVGGGLYFSFSTPIVTDCIFSENHADSYAGGLFLGECTGFDVSVCSAELNTSDYGGGVQVSSGSGTFDHCGFRANSATSDGGAIHASEAASIAITNSLINDNYAGGYGGGMMCTNSALADIAASTLYGNTAGTGGGCFVDDGTWLDMDNTIIAFNGGGGAVGCANGGFADLACCDVYGNVGGDWTGCIAGQDTAGSMSFDPLFCNADLYDFRLAPCSPCLTGPCGQIGALGLGENCYGLSPMIVSVTDVGNDQGRQARLKWRRSIYDVPGNEIDITGYTIFRRQDAHLARPEVPEKAVAVDTPAQASSTGAADVLILKAEGWDQIGYVLAYGDSIYQVVAPTLCDSTDGGICWSVFMVRAATPDPFTCFDSDPDSGYSIDNLAPAPPPGLMMTSETELAWEEVPDEDFDYYSVYGSALEQLDETATLIGYTIGTSQDVAGHVYDYYHVTATDFSGNEGEESSVNNAFAGIPGIGDTPTAFALKQNRPNPFSTTTVIAFDLPEETNARIRIYDTHGRVIKSLTDTNYEAGRHAVTWRGQDDRGNQVGPGVYFIRLEAGGFEGMKKVMLLR